VLIDFSTKEVSVALSTAVSTAEALTGPVRVRVEPMREERRWVRREEPVMRRVEEDLRPVKVERETRSEEDWFEPWW
jgi:hypothetical protein